MERTQRGPPKTSLAPSQQSDVMDLFALFDTDGGGTLDEDEVKIALITLGFLETTGEEVEEYLRHLDVEDKGGLNHEQFLTLVTEKVGQRNVRKELKQSFELMAHGERYMKVQDFIDAARDPEIQAEDGDEELRHVWKYLDVGKDGYMNEEQFLQLMVSDWESHV
eukprot:TRINITY_DN26556_c0_g2_i1.p1 TRINITY_DN26556_c0_g2~~TRINITY_DN26556_c0_g2_i1.p1  ORF type:complete len:165 (-),score=44.93 TRINITY_DN26556_c0_g2_i1:218-712(-)